MWWKVTLQGDDLSLNEPLNPEAHRLASARSYRLPQPPIFSLLRAIPRIRETFSEVDTGRLPVRTERRPTGP